MGSQSAKHTNDNLGWIDETKTKSSACFHGNCDMKKHECNTTDKHLRVNITLSPFYFFSHIAFSNTSLTFAINVTLKHSVWIVLRGKLVKCCILTVVGTLFEEKLIRLT